MNYLRQLAHRSPIERRLFFSSFVLLWAIRLGLWLLPFSTLQQILKKIERPAAALPHSYAITTVNWAVTRASRFVVQPTCLVQALAAQVLLERNGSPTRLRIGFTRDETGTLKGHAWLESMDQVVVGGSELERFTPMSAFEQARSIKGLVDDGR
jgi:hypothetical protein